MDFETLVDEKSVADSIRNWANDAGIPARQILVEAEASIYKRLLCRQMLQTATGTLQVNDTSFLLPSRYQANYQLRWTGAAVGNIKPPRKRDLDEVIASWAYDGDGNRIQGTPSLYATDENSIQLNTACEQQYPYFYKFYGSLPRLSQSNPTNFLTDEYPALLRSACLLRAAEFRKNQNEKQYWVQLFAAELDEANKSDDQERYGTDIDHDVNP